MNAHNDDGIWSSAACRRGKVTLTVTAHGDVQCFFQAFVVSCGDEICYLFSNLSLPPSAGREMSSSLCS